MRKASDTCLNVNRVRFTFNGILLKFGDERMELSQKLKEIRKKQGLTQLELAERLFVSRQAISGWEAGTSRPSTENLQSLSKLYNVPLEMLLDDAEAAGPEPEKIPEEERPEKEKHEPGPDKARRKDDKKKKRLVVGVALILIIGMLIVAITFLLKNNYETTDISRIPGEEVEVDSSGIVFEW